MTRAAPEAVELAVSELGFHPFAILRWALRAARGLVKLNAQQSAAWDVVQAIIDSQEH